MNTPDPSLLTRRLADQLRERGQMICTAESCTGGQIAKTLTDLAGSSDWFERGFVTYSNEAKKDMLGISESTLAVHGAVSEPVAMEMAAGAIAHSRAQVAVAVTGIAGPGGGSDEKPVGLVWFGFSVGGSVTAERQVFGGSREEVRGQSVVYALSRVIELMVD